ncbi:MAG: glycoside hydrolase family 29 (alpha-L-fucosidase) [Pedobacter sp.]|nr:MAG: glycoside hydrolase family 29 (alpha-L-fucosidase) [Pedobacter sp.]
MHRKSIFAILLFTAYTWSVLAQSSPKPHGAVPNKHQLTWQNMEYYMFIHFGPNTFTDKEWGHGDEDPKVFNPKKLDAGQWARTAKAAGMTAIIITAKHHDGFCLFPSKYSTHTVRESAWKDGQGDVLKELSAACKEYGLKFGVYLSPWDRNHPDYGTSKYNDVFANTLNEVHTQYGPIFEQWFDGAKGEGEKKQDYDFQKFYAVVRKNNPQAVIFSDIGPDVRWMGNEKGIAGETNWSTLNTDGFGVGADAPPAAVLNTGNEGGKYWIPAEVDVSIRPGWFYSAATDDKVKTLKQLESIWNTSVGRNANLLLNVPVNRDGLIHPADSTRLMELRKFLDAAYKTNLAKGKNITGVSTRGSNFVTKNLIDGNPDTYWSATENFENAEFTIDFVQPVEMNRIVLQEYLKLGQRTKSFAVLYWDGREYKVLDQQTTIGHKRILSFPTIKTSKLKFHFDKLAVPPAIAEVGVYKAPDL